jgi:hypothetical protein
MAQQVQDRRSRMKYLGAFRETFGGTRASAGGVIEE